MIDVPARVNRDSSSRTLGVASRWFRIEWDRTLGVGLVALGSVALGVTYGGVRNSGSVVDQLVYLTSGGLGAMALLVLGASWLLVTDLADEWRKIDRIEAALRSDEDHHRTAPRWVSLPVALRRPLLVAGGGSALGVAILVVAYVRAAGGADPQPAVRALGLGVVGLMVIGASAAAWVLSTSRVVKLRETRVLAPWLLEELRQRVEIASIAAAGGSRPDTTAPESVVVVAGLRRFHDPSCAAIAGLPFEVFDRAAVDAALEPCGLCLS